jgi:heterotetrameric sarcosine oxidase gamma subunit
LHDWHERNGAVFVKMGLWLRPLVYSAAKDTSWAPVLAEARAVRRSVGLTDVSSLGKIDVQGQDAPAFLDRIYANTFSTLPVGKARYGLMLREDGMVFDDGTTARLSDAHFFITTTTANAGAVLEHLEFHRDTVWPDLDVRITDVADQWAQFAVAGPSARAVLAEVVDRDLSDDAFPFMAAGEAAIAGVLGRLFRISFSGELAYEVSVPSRSAERVWEAILQVGEPFGITPYGLDALNVLRIEKGHVAGSEINGQTTARDLGLERMRKKSGDFVGRVLAQRSALTDPSRLGLVGVRVLDSRKTLRAGAHLLAEASSRESLGFVTAACPRTEGEGFIGLALLRGGPERYGETLHASDPVRGQFSDVEIVPPHFVDPGNERVKSAVGAGARFEDSGRQVERPTRATRPHVSPALTPPGEQREPREAGVTLSERRLDIVTVTLSPLSEKRDGTEPRDTPCRHTDPTWLAREGVEALDVSPTTSLLIRPRSKGTPLLRAVRSGPCPCCSAVDQSDAYRVFRAAGPQAEWVLSKGCRIDLNPVAFGKHRVARTIIAQIPIVLYQVEERCFDLFAPASLARSFTDFLTLSAADVGLSWSETCEDKTR